MSKIEWTDETWNPTVGCTRVSPGCDNCYAIRVAHRGMSPLHKGLTIQRPGEPVDWTNTVRCLPDRLDQPLRWRKPRRVFVDSMSDLFHTDVPNDFIVEVFARMEMTTRHTYQVLTKRPQRMASLLNDRKFSEEVYWTVDDRCGDGPQAGADFSSFLSSQHRCDSGGSLWPNIWLGTSIETERYLFRADHLRHIDSQSVPVRFLSLEPLLGPLPSLDLSGIDWVIVGGESGPGARPMDPDWVRQIRDHCVAFGVPFFFKQWGEWAPTSGSFSRPLQVDGELYAGESEKIEAETMARVGKKAAGRTLDGRTWDEMPPWGAR